MNFQIFGKKQAPTLLLIPGLGVSYEIFLPLIRLVEERFRIIAVEVDGFTLGKHTRFTSVDDQASQIIAYVQAHCDGHLDCAYGLSLGGKILSRILERNVLTIDHAILDAAPLLPLPNWLVNPLRHYQAINVWTCYHWTGFWKAVFRNHYFDVLLDECKKTWPWGGRQAVLDGYKSVYTNKLESISGNDIHFWYGTKEAFVAKPQAKHLLSLYPQAHVEIFEGMNHGQLLVDHPEEIVQRIIQIISSSFVNRYFEPIDIEPAGVVVFAGVTGTEETHLRADPMTFHGLELLAGFRPMLAVGTRVELTALGIRHLHTQINPFVRYGHL